MSAPNPSLSPGMAALANASKELVSKGYLDQALTSSDLTDSGAQMLADGIRQLLHSRACDSDRMGTEQKYVQYLKMLWESTLLPSKNQYVEMINKSKEVEMSEFRADLQKKESAKHGELHRTCKQLQEKCQRLESEAKANLEKYEHLLQTIKAAHATGVLLTSTLSDAVSASGMERASQPMAQDEKRQKELDISILSGNQEEVAGTEIQKQDNERTAAKGRNFNEEILDVKQKVEKRKHLAVAVENGNEADNVVVSRDIPKQSNTRPIKAARTRNSKGKAKESAP